ncbi:MAG: DUF2339 domain-containing protein [Cytophaga sp.]|nr:DUF2339 domain-containing protein [Cytophaga sp.]
MPDNQKQLDELTKKIHLIELRQEQINADLLLIKKEIASISSSSEVKEEVTPPVLPTLPTLPTLPVKDKSVEVMRGPVIEPAFPVIPRVPKEPKKEKEKTPLEEFIGTNLLNKVGIAVLVIGIGIGAKYAIDHDLISHLTRIVLGYLCGIILIALGIKLKAKYESFSAVLLSGGMAVLYFITFAAYDLYQLIPQMMAFALMVLFTAFTVFAAVQYNLQVIAIIALVGAYGVPFLLSNGSGRIGVLFTYMSIINGGILILSFKKTWKALYYSAFTLTWLIYAGWVMVRYQADDHLWISLVFSSIFFITFYVTLLSYKLLQSEPLSRWDIILLTANSFIYYGFGYYVIDKHQSGELFLGVFTLFNAVLHFLACYVIYKKQDATRDTFYFVAGLVLVFLTLAVPVQLDGNWVTLIWAAEAVLLFWIGRTKNFPVYERLSYVLILLAFGSLVQDWDDFYGHYYKGMKELYVRFFLNIQFLSSLLVCVALGAIFKISRDHQLPSPGSKINLIFNWALPSLLVITLYFSFYSEIDNFWSQKYIDSEMTGTRNEYEYNFFDNDLPRLETIWVMIYSSVFITLLAFVNHRFVKNKMASYLITGFAAFLLLSFISVGLTELGGLRDSFLTQEDAKYYFRTSSNIIIRYVAILVMLPLLVIVYTNMQAEEVKDAVKKMERAFFHFIILALLSSELINLLDMAGITDSDKLALSILWGGYALMLIIYGLIKNIKFIRIMAISLFGITLVKLFLYDLSSMSTIAKTVVMMVLGVLLLVASFLYNKFKRAADQKTEEADHASDEAN